MTESSAEELEVLRALQIVESRLDEAESVMWGVSTERDQLNERLDEVTQDIWSLQHEIEEIKTEVE